jgi:hypothetical protein
MSLPRAIDVRTVECAVSGHGSPELPASEERAWAPRS